MSSQFAKLAVVHWALVAGNNAYALNRMYNELHDADIHNIVAELREIQSHLNDLDLWFHDRRIKRLMPRETNDMETGIAACTASLARLDEIVKSVTTAKRGEPTSRVWGETKATFKGFEGPLYDRLNAHRVWLTQLFPILKMHFIFSKPQTRTEVERLHTQIRYVNGVNDDGLREQREKEWEEYYQRVAEHVRAARYVQPPSPQYSPTQTGFVSIPQNPQPMYPHPLYMYHQTEPSSQYRSPTAAAFQGYPSPPTSNSSTNSPQSARSRFSLHYPPQLSRYDSIHPSSPTAISGNSEPQPETSDSWRFVRPSSRSEVREPEKPYYRSSSRPPSREGRRPRRQSVGGRPQSPESPRSQCFGRQIDAGNLSLTASEQEIMAVDFDSDMMVALYRNKETDASRIVCAVSLVKSWVSDHRGGGPSQGSIKVTALTIRRESKYVLVLNRNRHLWARLVFSDFENMTFFFNTFLALRCHSPSQDPVFISESEKWLAGERSVWSAFLRYKEDTYRLHLLQEGGSGAVRIAAMVDEPGPQSNMTIWTTFLHDQISAPQDWYRQESATVVLLSIPIFHFSTIFQPQHHPEFPLQFVNSRDATRFLEEVDDLRRR